jgi:uncharacterized protein YceH (UPF0502 family)
MEYHLDPTERRIVGVLIEKELTTPEGYPLSLQALVTGCNQKSNRDPVVRYQTFEVEGALRSLFQKHWVTTTNLFGRIEKWKHRVLEHLPLTRPGIAVLAELLLRGAQQPGELRARSERMAPELKTIEQLSESLAQLSALDPPLVLTLERLPGERVERVDHRLYQEERTEPKPVGAPRPTLSADAGARAPLGAAELERRLIALEHEAAQLRAIVREMLSPSDPNEERAP